MDLLSVVEQALESLESSFRKEILSEVLNSLELVKNALEQEERPPTATIAALQELIVLLRTPSPIDGFRQGTVRRLYAELLADFEQEVEGKIRIVFFPYKASMWDSLESVYLAALKDDEVDAKVVPIPYFKLSDKGDEPCYEGDLFPEGIPITHYSAYDLTVERPDIVFVHNIYDQYNTLTRVFEEYHTYNLRKHTDMLVYVPYNLASFVPPKPGSGTEMIAYGLPSVANVDKIILSGDHLADAAMKFGIPHHKLLPLGSPKVDKLVFLQRNGVSYPDGWAQLIEGCAVFLLDTHLSFFSRGAFLSQLELLIKLLNIPNYIHNSVLIWRPHPLLSAFIRQRYPWFLGYYEDLVRRMGTTEYASVIYDDTPDYFPALIAADVYIGYGTSLGRAALVSGKPIMLLGSRLSHDSLVPAEAFYYVGEERWVERLASLAEGDDPKTAIRKGCLRGIYNNIDGTSGQKILAAVKEALLFGRLAK